ncbi:Permease [Planctomycetales bacterium 10988]|nr:Permease [Planctomycetales bacterium 10988]
MSFAPDQSNPYASFGTVAEAPAADRAGFLARTYLHLLGAVIGLVGLEVIWFQLLPAGQMAQLMMGNGGWNWLIVLGLFMFVSWIAERWAHNDANKPMQYAGLGLYVVAQSLILFPLLAIATAFYPGVLPQAAILTLAIFGALTVGVLITRYDFSFMGPALAIGGIAALGFIVVGILFGFNFGLFFSIGMIVLMCGYILYHTSNVLHHYGTEQYVAASLALFASLATLFWYVLQLLMALQRD